jgi:hypothetical protein
MSGIHPPVSLACDQDRRYYQHRRTLQRTAGVEYQAPFMVGPQIDTRTRLGIQMLQPMTSLQICRNVSCCANIHYCDLQRRCTPTTKVGDQVDEDCWGLMLPVLGSHSTVHCISKPFPGKNYSTAFLVCIASPSVAAYSSKGHKTHPLQMSRPWCPMHKSLHKSVVR